MKTNRKGAILGAAAGFFLGLAVLPLPAANGFARPEPAQKLIGQEIRNQKNEKLGKLDDVVLDLESGRVIYAVVSVTGGKVGVPPNTLWQTAENKPLMSNLDQQKLSGAPKFTSEIQNNLGSVNFASEVYRHFNQQAWWDAAAQPTGRATFGNVHKASELNGITVMDSANETVGKVANVLVDLADARIPYLALALTSTFGDSQSLYPIPPNAFTAGSNQKSLVTGLDRQKLQAAPKIPKNNLQQLSDPTFATSIYQFYGKQPYWNSGAVSPTGRTGSGGASR